MFSLARLLQFLVALLIASTDGPLIFASEHSMQEIGRDWAVRQAAYSQYEMRVSATRRVFARYNGLVIEPEFADLESNALLTCCGSSVRVDQEDETISRESGKISRHTAVSVETPSSYTRLTEHRDNSGNEESTRTHAVLDDSFGLSGQMQFIAASATQRGYLATDSKFTIDRFSLAGDALRDKYAVPDDIAILESTDGGTLFFVNTEFSSRVERVVLRRAIRNLATANARWYDSSTTVIEYPDGDDVEMFADESVRDLSREFHDVPMSFTVAVTPNLSGAASIELWGELDFRILPGEACTSERFHITFPSGTMVNDQRGETVEWYTVQDTGGVGR